MSHLASATFLSLFVAAGCTSTGQPSATIPDFSALGLPLQKSDLFDWLVESFGPFVDVDSAAGPQGLYLSTANDWNYTSSILRTFTSAP